MISDSLPRRLGKLVREATGESVQAVDRLWCEGRIRMGRAAPFGLAELIYDDDSVFVDDLPLGPAPARVHFVLHKPEGITTTTQDPCGFPDLRPWLRTLPQGVFPVGRLDRETSGLLLLTNDGDLAYALLAPSHVEKEYLASVRWCIPPDDSRIEMLRRGVSVGSEVLVPARVELLGNPSFPSNQLCIVVREGRHRQVRRMCRAASLPTSALARTRIGPMHIGELRQGEVRALSSDEVDKLWHAVGGHAAIRARQLHALHALATRRRQVGTPDPRLEAWLMQAHHG